MNLFVAKLSPSVTGEELQELFSQYGEVASAKVIFDKETGNSKGYGFVEMPNTDEAKSAITALNESEIDGKQIVVKEANDRVEKPRGEFQRRDGFKPRSGGGGGGFQRRDDRRGGGGGGRDDRRGGGSSGGNRRNDNRNRGGGGGGYERENNWY